MTRGARAATPGAGPATTLLDNVKVVHAFSLTPASRDCVERSVPIDTEDDDILEIELWPRRTLLRGMHSRRIRRARPDYAWGERKARAKLGWRPSSCGTWSNLPWRSPSIVRRCRSR